METGNRIKERRLALGLTQQQLADAIGVSKTFVSDLENNRGSPTIKTLERFTTALAGQVVIEWGDINIPDLEN